MEQIQELTDILSKTFDKVMKLNADLLKQLTPEQQKQILPMQKDINKILKSVKEGDILAINEIQKKYADTNI